MKSIQLQAGQKFNRLTIIKLDHIREYISPKDIKQNQEFYLCKCDCGNECIVSKRNILNNNTQSCGCLQKEKAFNNSKKHGLFYTKIYKTYYGIITRCFNKSRNDYKNYGGRGITICEEWKNDFKVFYDWSINNGYKDNLSIDRINNDGNYEPSNCRWITKKQQARNTRRNHFITYNSETHCISEWAENYNINYHTLHTKINRDRQSLEKILINKKGLNENT